MSSVEEQKNILIEALAIYQDRHERRGDQWKQYGWRGALFNVRICAERAWRYWFNRSKPLGADRDVDELLDVINYAAMAIRAIREGNRDGLGGWWDDNTSG